MASYWKAFRQFDRNILLYLFYWSMISFAYFGIVGVLMNLYLLRLGYETEFIGLVLGSGQLVWAAFALPAGAIGSRVGAKKAMVAGMVVLAAGIVLMLAAEWLPSAARPVGLVLTWMLSWVGAALSAVNSAPYLMSVTNDQTRSFAFSAQQTVMAATGFAGSVAAGILPGIIASQMNRTMEDPAPYRLALLLAPLAYLAAAWAFSRAKPAVPLAQQDSFGTQLEITDLL